MEALKLQLSAACRASSWDGMLLADQEGVCLAHVGDEAQNEEIAAQIPMVGRKTHDFAGVLYGPGMHCDIRLRRFDVDGYPLFLCGIGTSDASLMPSVEGVARILAA